MTAASFAEERRPLPDWMLKASQRCRQESIHRLSSSTVVAGVRGARVRANDLYWMDAGESAFDLVKLGERAESEGKSDEAERLYAKSLAIGATGRDAWRASLGLATRRMAAGDRTYALESFERLYRRASDPEMLFSSAMPLALLYANDGRRDEAAKLLEELVRRTPDHPLAGTADSLITMIRGM